MGRHADTLRRMQERVSELIESFGQYVDEFDRANLFSGPSLYFHFKTLDLLHRHVSPAEAVKDGEFLESIYATLTSWGMHRMGPRGAKLVEFATFQDSFRQRAEQIQQLGSLSICEVDTRDIPHVARLLWNIISRLRVGMGETKIVAGSKALHHVLPNLVPPIDRQYTLRFFYNHTTLNRGDETAFLEIYPCFHRIATSRRDVIQSRMGKGMNTSPTKVVDNTIVGYCLKHLGKIQA
jgi:hypothetical protein